MSEIDVGLSVLPDGWVWTTVENCTEILDRQRVPINAKERETRIRGKSSSELYPYYGATGQVGWIDDYLFDDELVLLGEDGAPFLDFSKDKAYLIKDKNWVNNHAHVLRSRINIISNQLLCHYLNTYDYRDYVTGTTRLKLNQSMMRKIPVPLPPLPEQNRIVVKIEELFTKLNAGKEELLQAKARLKRYRQSVLKAAMDGKLTEDWRKKHGSEIEPASVLLERILKERREKWEAEQLEQMRAKGKMPKDDKWKNKYKEPQTPDTSKLPDLPDGWLWVTLPQIGELNRGKSKHRPRNASFLYGGRYPFLQTGDIKQANGLIGHYNQTYSEEGLKQSRLWPAGTLCITIAANIADTAILGFDACFPDSVVGFFPEKGQCNIRFVEFFLRTAKENLERYAPATAQKNINLGTLKNLAIPFPPLAEQNMITEEIDRYLSVADAVKETLDAELKRSDALRQSILKQAFSGKLVPQNPNDEPAEKLLERITKEKAKRESEQKTNRKAKKQLALFGH